MREEPPRSAIPVTDRIGGANFAALGCASTRGFDGPLIRGVAAENCAWRRPQAPQGSQSWPRTPRPQRSSSRVGAKQLRQPLPAASRPPPGDAKTVTDLLGAVQVVDGHSLSAPARAQTTEPAKIEGLRTISSRSRLKAVSTLWTSVVAKDDMEVLKPRARRGASSRVRCAAS